jgi:hypothetical protein
MFSIDHANWHFSAQLRYYILSDNLAASRHKYIHYDHEDYDYKLAAALLTY